MIGCAIEAQIAGTPAEVDRVLEENDPREAEKMITNIERTLDEMKRQAVIEGKVDTARVALREGLDVDVICKITWLSRETVLGLKNEMEN
jgi:hypothetical protein